MKNPFAHFRSTLSATIWSGHQSMPKLLSFYLRCFQNRRKQLRKLRCAPFCVYQVGPLDLTHPCHTILSIISVRRTKLRSNQILPLTSLIVSLAYPQFPRSMQWRSEFQVHCSAACQQQIQTSAARSKYAAVFDIYYTTSSDARVQRSRP